jgi:hypothetical protein
MPALGALSKWPQPDDPVSRVESQPFEECVRQEHRVSGFRARHSARALMRNDDGGFHASFRSSPPLATTHTLMLLRQWHTA